MSMDETAPEDDVAAALEAALEQEPDSAQLWIEYALWLDEVEEDPAAAEAALRRAVATGNEPWLARVHLAMWLKDRADGLPEARQLLEDAIKAEPEDSFAHAALGDVLAELGLLDRAEAPYRRALELDGDNALAWCGLATVLTDFHGDFDSAEQALGAALEIDEDCAPAWYQLAELYERHLGRPDEAEQARNRAKMLMQAEGFTP